LKPGTLPRVIGTISCYDLVAVLLSATAVLMILCAVSLAAWRLFVHSHGVFASVTLGGDCLWLSGAGVLLGCGGFLACRVLEGRSYVRSWVLYVYALAFFVFSFVLLIEWFGS